MMSPLGVAVRGVHIARGRIQWFVSQKDLDRGRIGAMLGQIGGKSVPQNMRRHRHINTQKLPVFFYSLLHITSGDFFIFFIIDIFALKRDKEIRGVGSANFEIGLQIFNCPRRQVGKSFFFTLAQDIDASLLVYFIAAQIHQFWKAQASGK